MRLLLISNTTQHGLPALAHCADAVRAHFAGCSRVLIIPWALADWDARADAMIAALDRCGVTAQSVHRGATLGDADGVFIPGGNTFRLLRAMQRADLIGSMQTRVANGLPYMGTSAGSNVACPTICTTNDMPIVHPNGFDALNLVPFQINAHYLDPDPTSTHQGETRETRIREFHEENRTPVVGLREGCWLDVDSSGATLRGPRTARYFRPGQPAIELTPGQTVPKTA